MIASATLQKVDSYIRGVLSGEIVACEAVQNAIKRHCRDVQRSLRGDPSFPYRFDPALAELALDFIETCCRHSIGEFAEMPFILEPWQAFGVAMIFGWVRVDDNSRRFRKVYWSMARKNGKSTLGGAIALFLASMDVNPKTGKPEAVAEIILSATKKDQAKDIIYAEICRMREKSPAIKERSNEINQTVRFGHNDGKIKAVGSDKPYDGLNPSAVILDEVHAWRERHREFYNTMQTGSGSRTQPIIMTLTTAGDDRSYIWLEEYNYARRVASGEFVDESLFSFIFEMDKEDDVFDQSLWVKANPNVSISVKAEYLQERATEGSQSKMAENRFTRYHANRLVSSAEAAFSIPQWDACTGELSDWSKADAIGLGIDLGGRDDFAAWGAVARFIVGEIDYDDDEDTRDLEEGESERPQYLFRYELRAFVYIAEDTERDLTEAPFAQWVYEDRIKVTKFPITDMMADILEFCEENEVEDVAYDPAGGQTMAELLEADGLVAARMPQTYAMFNEPLNEFSSCMTDGRLLHSGCPVLRWCVGNAVACRDRQDRWMLDKRKSKEKIDPVVSLVMGFFRAMKAAGRLTDDNLIVTS